jgi:hypothetical protein
VSLLPFQLAAQSFSLRTSPFQKINDISSFSHAGFPDQMSRLTATDFRRIALSLEGVEEYSHAGLPAFRVGGRKFASLASQAGGYGNLMLTLEQQAAFVEEAPEIFLPIPGGWGKMGHTHIRLAAASEDVLTGALRTAWKLRIDKNAKTSRKKTRCGGAQRSNR